MSMEKNGAISSETPSCKSGCGCSRTKSASQTLSLPGQLTLFPETSAEADKLDLDVTKAAADVVRDASTTK
jgi:hypothetical protein